MWAWLLFFLALLVAMARLGDFVIGKSGNRQLKERLAEFYVAIDGRWRASYQVPAQVLSGFFRQVFGSHPLMAILRMAAISVTVVTVLVFASLGDRVIPGRDMTHRPELAAGEFLGVFLPGNVVGDIVSWTSALWALRVTATGGPLKSVAGLLLAAAAAALSFAISLALPLFYLLIVAIGGVRFTRESPTNPHTDAFMAATSSGVIILIPLVVLLPLLMYALTVGSGLTLYALRPALRGPLQLILERLDASEKPVLTIIAGFIAGVSILLSAFLHAIHWI